MIVHSLTLYKAIVAYAECRQGGPPTMRSSLHIGATFFPLSLSQSIHLWTEPYNAIAAREINRYNRARC
jgi:hypothetical protein